MAKRYFRKQNPLCRKEDVVWVEMTGREYYRFVCDPANSARRFIDMDNVVLECSEATYRQHKAETDHSDYLAEQKRGWSIVSLYAGEDENGCGGEDALEDITQDVEAETIRRLQYELLREALEQLSQEDYRLIKTLYFCSESVSARCLAALTGLSHTAILKRKKKIIKNLRFLVSKTKKSSQ